MPSDPDDASYTDTVDTIAALIEEFAMEVCADAVPANAPSSVVACLAWVVAHRLVERLGDKLPEFVKLAAKPKEVA